MRSGASIETSFFIYYIVICVPVLLWLDNVNAHGEVGTSITGQKNTLNLLGHEEIVIDVGHQKFDFDEFNMTEFVFIFSLV